MCKWERCTFFAVTKNHLAALFSLIKDHGVDPNPHSGLIGIKVFNCNRNCLTRFALLYAGAEVEDDKKQQCCLAELPTGIYNPLSAKALIEHSLAPWDVNVLDKNGETPFIRAVKNCCFSCIKLLMKDKRTNVNLKDSTGKTALHWLIYGCEHPNAYSICSLILSSQRTNPAVKDKLDGTPLESLQSLLSSRFRAVNNKTIECLKKFKELFELRKMKVQLYLSLKNRHCSEHCHDEKCSHIIPLPADVCLKIARLLTIEFLPQIKEASDAGMLTKVYTIAQNLLPWKT